MFAGLNILPVECALGPMRLSGAPGILERPSSPNCQAGTLLWHLYNVSAGQPSGRISACLGDLHFSLEGSETAGPLLLGRSLGSAGRGAGLLLCADRSCLIFRSNDRGSWQRGAEPQRTVDILPVVHQVAQFLPYGSEHIVAPEATQTPSGSSLSFSVVSRSSVTVTDIEASEITRALTAQLCWEATAWGNILDEIPSVSPGAAWPEAFPYHALDTAAQARFHDHAAAAARFILDAERHLLSGLSVRVISAMRLQGGIAPARISLHLESAGGKTIPSDEHDRIFEHLSRLIFQGEFAADLLVAQEFRTGKNGSHGLERVQLANIHATGLISNHERIDLIRRFASGNG